MAYQYNDIMQAALERIDAEAATASADLEAARMREDSDGTMWAAQRILELDAQRAALAQRANQFVAQQQAYTQRSNRWGLTDQEIEVAKNARSHGTVEERIKDYAANKARYQHMRATGAYRDDQGSLKR